jgi:YesN/AraC family two-component response regulator
MKENKELTTEEKAQRYDEALKYAKSALDCLADDYICNHLTKDDIRGMYAKLFPELKESEDEDERIRKRLIHLVNKSHEQGGYALHKDEAEEYIAWLEKQGEQKSNTDFSDLRTWKYIVDAVWTEKEGIGQYLDSPFTEEVAKKLQKRFGNIIQNYEWSEEDENRINRLIAYFEDKESFTAEDDIVYANWLKSLRPQSQWKPTEEQMNALNDVISSRDIKYDVLSELWKDLKQL